MTSNSLVVYYTNKTDRHDIPEIVLKVALNTIVFLNIVQMNGPASKGLEPCCRMFIIFAKAVTCNAETFTKNIFWRMRQSYGNAIIMMYNFFQMDVKNKICEGKKKNCNKCDRILLPGDNFCGTCGTKIEDEDGMTYIFFSNWKKCSVIYIM